MLNCHLLAAHSEIKLERFRKAAETCESILRVEENYEALIVKATSLAAQYLFPEAIVCYKRANIIFPDDKDSLDQIKLLKK